MKSLKVFILFGAVLLFARFGPGPKNDAPRRGEVLFIGDTVTVVSPGLRLRSKPASQYASMLAVKLFRSGINLSYLDDINEIDQNTLAGYDAIVVYQQISASTTRYVQALQSFVQSGKGLVVLNNKTSVPFIRDAGQGRLYQHGPANSDSTWTNLRFQNFIRDKIQWALGEKVIKQIAALNIPAVSVYEGVDTITDMRKPHMVKHAQQPLSPEESMKLTQVPAGFELQLFAAEPDIIKPMAMAWDEKGRLWVAETVDFPSSFTKEDGVANDRIKICEDTDGDGRADKFTIFADSLNIPTAIAFANGGIIVGQAPDIIFFKDTDGDDKADIRKVLATGWNKRDTHGGLGHFQYGFDNRIWGTSGMSGYRGGIIDGKYYNFGNAIFSIGVNGKNFKYHGTTGDNTFGLGFTEDNNVFASSANNGHSKFFSLNESEIDQHFTGEDRGDMIRGVQYIAGHTESHIATPNFRQVDCVGGFTSACNHNFYTARNFPKKYWNRIAFVTDPTIHVVHNAIIEPDGAGFKERDGWNLLSSSDECEGVVQAQVGPDGAVWVADFYTFVFQHFGFGRDEASIGRVVPYEGEQQRGKGSAFVTPYRNKSHGRIYRIVYKNGKNYQPLKLSKDNVPQLIEALKNDNMFWRATAQRLLVELQDRSIASDLYTIINNTNVDEIGLNGPAVHALWTLHGLNLINNENPRALEAVKKALHHPAAGVRKAAFEVLPKNEGSLQTMTANKLLFDKDLNVRLNILRVLNEYPVSPQLGEIAFNACLDKDNATDKWLRKGILNLAVKNASVFREKTKRLPVRNAIVTDILKVLGNLSYEMSPESNSINFNPDIAGKGIVVRCRLSLIKNFETKEMVKSGLIYAHGDRDNGYSLQVDNGKILFNVFQKGIEYKAAANFKLTEGQNSQPIEANFLPGGSLVLKFDTIIVAKAKAPGLFTSSLEAPIRIGNDLENDHRITDKNEMSGFGSYGPRISLQLLDVVNGKVKIIPAKTASMPKVATPVNLTVVKDMMKYDKKEFTVKAGTKVIISFNNPDGMPHNLLIGKPGTLDKIGAAADALAQDPGGAKSNYVPKMPEVLFATKLVEPGKIVTLEFVAPKEPGNYPYACTFPGHWRMMNGIMKVVK